MMNFLLQTDFQRRLRLFLLFLLVSFSFGGFTFYAAVVVPVGSEVTDPTTQGFVTRKVTHFLNIASGFTWLAFAWEWFAERRARPRWSNVAMLFLLILFGLSLIGLVLLHPAMDKLLRPDNQTIQDPEKFYQLHRYYLWTNTIQWLSTLGILTLICQSQFRKATLK